MKYISPCDEIWKVEHNEHEWYYWHFRYYVEAECKRIYKQEWETTVKELKSCNNLNRKRRGLLGNATKRFFKTLVSNLIQALDLGSLIPDMNVFHKSFDMDKLYTSDRQEYLKICSKAASSQEHQTKNEATFYPRLFWAIAKVHGEILANTANLRKIMYSCKNNKMATKALGDLTNDDTVYGIPEDKTFLPRIDVDDDTLTFNFSVLGDEKFNFSIFAYCGFGVIASTLITLSCFKFIKHFQKKSDLEAGVSVRMKVRPRKSPEAGESNYDTPQAP